jgi:hypothetical protein
VKVKKTGENQQKKKPGTGKNLKNLIRDIDIRKNLAYN